MGLTNVLNSAAKAAMAAAGDLKITVDIYMINGDPVYDDATGEYTIPLKQDIDVEALVYEFEGKEVIEQVNFSTDQRMLVESRFIVNATAPSYFDIDGIKWDVISPIKIPGDSIREFHIRNTGESI